MTPSGIKAGCIVVRHEIIGVYRVLWVSADGKRAEIEPFDISKQKPRGAVLHAVTVRTLTLYKEDAR
jgi:hypothetical protein